MQEKNNITARLINSLRALSDRISQGRNPLNPPYQGICRISAKKASLGICELVFMR